MHYPNMKQIPTWALYGETQSRYDWLHWETIQSRSRLHDFRIAPHRHEQFVQLLWLQSGRGEVTLDGEAIPLRRGSLAIVPPLTVHSYSFSRNVAGIVVTLMERDLADLGVDIPSAQVLSVTPAIASALESLIAEADHPAAEHDRAIKAHLTLLLVALARATQSVTQSSEEGDRALLHARAFRHLVEQRFRTTRRVSDYARAIGISQTHLNRVVRQVLGASALEVIERRIALEARRQLLFSTLTIKQIGAELGYDDPAYFTRFVTRALGAAPGTLRREGLAR